jgi:nicotinamide-nucleotide amidase
VLAAQCLQELRARGHTLATAESLTCGLVAATLAEVPGASDVLRGGLAAYASEVKVSVLGVDETLVERFGVVSPQCAEAMAVAARLLFAADWAVSTTGVAGPDRQEGHPIGTVFVAVAGPELVRGQSLHLGGGRQQIRVSTVDAALSALLSASRELRQQGRSATPEAL